VAASVLGLTQLDVETSTSSVLSRHDPEWAFYQKTQERFGGDEFIAVMVESDPPLSLESLKHLANLTAAIEKIPGVRRVDSLATVPLIESSNESLSLSPAVVDGEPTPSEIDLITRLQDDWAARESLLSSDGRNLGLNVFLEAGTEDDYERVLHAISHELSHRSAHLSGVPVFRVAADKRTRREITAFVPITVVTIALLLFLLFGSLRAVTIPLLCAAIGVVVVLGIMGASGISLSIGTMVLPSVLIALSCAYSMHLLTASVQAADESERLDRLLEVALPISLSGLTTAIGFVAISFVRIDVVRQLGVVGAAGVLAVLSACLTAGPAMLRAWPVRQRRETMFRWVAPRLSDKLLTLANERPRILLGFWVVVAVMSVTGVPRVVIETDVIRWFAPDDPVRVSYGRIRDALSGISPINVVIEAPDGESVVSVSAIAAQFQMTRYLEAMPEVGRAISIADPISQLHEALQIEGGGLPENSALIEQYLLILESKGRLRDLITHDRAAANVVLRADDNGSSSLLVVAERAVEWWDLHGPAGYTARSTGIMYEFARSEEEIAWGQLKGLSFAVAAIAVILFAMFRSPLVSLVALLPNGIPVVCVFGMMGLFGIPLDAGTVAVGNLALGIAVDDTVHLLEGYQRRRSRGSSAADSLQETFYRVLPAIAFTTVVVALGFLVLSASGFLFVRNLGSLTAAIMVLCLLADTTLLPALLVRADHFVSRRGRFPS
jgi:predicted RND superfamily exporter protein